MLSPTKMRYGVPAGLALLVLVFFWKLVFTDEFVWFDHPDMVYMEIPRLQFQAREFAQNHFPLWDPSIWAGQSLIGQTQPGPLFPMNILFLLLPLDGGYLQARFLNLYWVVLHGLAALGCYALCREWGRGYGASVLAALGFGCGGFLGTVAWLDVAAGAVFTPWILLFLSRAVEGKRRWGSAALSGFVLGMAWLSGHHEIPLLVTLLVMLVWGVVVWLDWRKAGLAVVSLLVGGMVAAVQVWPTIEFGRLSKRWVGTADPVGWNERIPYTIATVYSMPARGILDTLLPNAERYADCAPYLGLAIVGMGMLGLACAITDRRVRWVAWVTGLALVFALGAATPLHGVLYSVVPGLGKARIPVRAIHVFNLGLCVMAAYGMDGFLAGQRQRGTRILAGVLLLFGIAAAGWAIGNRGVDNRLLLSGFLAVGMAAAALLRVRWAAGLWITVAMIEMQGVSTATYSSRYLEGQFRYARMLEENRDVAEFLRGLERQAPVRLDVKEADVPMNFGDYHGVDVLGGYVAGVPENLLRAETHLERTKTVLAVTHYLAKSAERGEQEALFEGRSGLKVFRNPESRPRAWSVHKAIGVASHGELRDRLQVQPLDVHRQTVLLGQAPSLETCDGDTVKILSRSSNRVRIQAQMRCEGMVILGDSYYPGWQATVDGKAAKIWEAYGFVRGVMVGAGDHQVEMRFRPFPVIAGAWLFFLGTAMTAGLVMGRR
jgi:hypothetical protein